MSAYNNEDLYRTLKELEIVDVSVLDTLLQTSKDEKIPLGELVIKKDIMNDDNLGRIIGDMIDTPYVNLTQVPIDDSVLLLVPEAVARKQSVICFQKDKEGIHVAMTDPTNRAVADFIGKKTGDKVNVYYTTEKSINFALSLYSKDMKSTFDDIIAENIEAAKGDPKAKPPIIKIVDTVIIYAYRNAASDIHIEPMEDYSLVRFRIDGMLQDIVKLPSDLHEQMVMRIKVMANLRTDEHKTAQDGKIVFTTEVENVDIRVSIVPLTDGEKVVMRLLSENSRQYSLQDLGFSESDLEKLKSSYQKTHGMVLATGPTGSGKTTTLYAILKLLNRTDINIMTIEDPVEYDIERVNQIQVNAKTGLTFAKGLRSIVRQDPDVVLVGEIRDEETADIAVNAAMTGHLVLSTLHTNDAATTMPRLLDMNVEPYLAASTINVVVGQRLVRKICLKCRVSEEKSIDEIDKSVAGYFPKGKKVRVYKGKGCPVCHHTGYIGRVGIYEVLVVDEKIKEAIMERKNADEIHDIAVKNGMTTMVDDGMKKVIQGVTTIDEVLRVARE